MSFGLSIDSQRSRFSAALFLAITADVVQWIGFPLLVEGALSPLDDILDVVVAVALSGLVGWHWEFMPSLLGKLVPGVDMVPLWTLAVAAAYRKSKQPHPGDRPSDKSESESPVRIIDVVPEKSDDGDCSQSQSRRSCTGQS
jgi:hypothetical protein